MAQVVTIANVLAKNEVGFSTAKSVSIGVRFIKSIETIATTPYAGGSAVTRITLLENGTNVTTFDTSTTQTAAVTACNA